MTKYEMKPLKEMLDNSPWGQYISFAIDDILRRYKYGNFSYAIEDHSPLVLGVTNARKEKAFIRRKISLLN